jgi:hypothetical protein
VAWNQYEALDVGCDPIVLGRRKFDLLETTFIAALTVEGQRLVDAVLFGTFLNPLIDGAKQFLVMCGSLREGHKPILAQYAQEMNFRFPRPWRVRAARRLVAAGGTANPLASIWAGAGDEHERLTITATVGTENAARQVTATRGGTFKVSLGQHFPVADPCGTNGRIRVLRKGGRTLTRAVHFSQSSRGVACFMEGP